jgi:hypothetical protein
MGPGILVSGCATILVLQRSKKIIKAGVLNGFMGNVFSL